MVGDTKKSLDEVLKQLSALKRKKRQDEQAPEPERKQMVIKAASRQPLNHPKELAGGAHVGSAPLKRAAPFLRVERGVKMFKRAYTCLVIGSRTIDWLLSISRRDWSAIYVDASAVDSPLGKVLQEGMGDVLGVRVPLKSEPVDVILTRRRVGVTITRAGLGSHSTNRHWSRVANTGNC